METKKSVLDITGFFFPHEYSGEVRGAQHQCLHMSTNARKETHYIQYGRLRCFDNNVSNLYNNDVIKKNKSHQNSFVCERVYVLYLLQHWSNSLSSFIKRTAKTSTCSSGWQLILEDAFIIALLGVLLCNCQYHHSSSVHK